MEIAPLDLFKWLRINTAGNALTREFTRQLLQALQWCHTKEVIHCDVKPSNILVFNEQLKLADFGSAYITGTTYNCDPARITTEKYRAPELHLLNYDWDYPVDLWSVGCVVYDLLDWPLVYPPYVDRIVELLGEPPKQDWEDDTYTGMLPRLQRYPGPMGELLHGLICYRAQRLTATDALSCDWFKDDYTDRPVLL